MTTQMLVTKAYGKYLSLTVVVVYYIPWGVKHNAKDQYTKQAQGGVNGPLPYLYYDYDNEDVRRDITCVPL